MQARRLAKRPSLGSRRGGAAPAPASEAAALGLPPPGPSPAAAAPGSWRPPLPPPRGTGPSRAAAAASSPVLLLLGEEDEDEEGAGRRRRARGRLAEKPRGGAEEDDDDEEEDEEVVVEVVDGDEDDEDAEERFGPLGPGRALPKGPARGAAKVRAGGAAGSRGSRAPGSEREREGDRAALCGAGREGCVRRPWAARGTAARRSPGGPGVAQRPVGFVVPRACGRRTLLPGTVGNLGAGRGRRGSPLIGPALTFLFCFGDAGVFPLFKLLETSKQPAPPPST